MATPNTGTILIRGARIADGQAARAEVADLLVRDGLIVERGQALVAPEGASTFDASGLLVHPGLINAHTHSNSAFMKGVGDRWSLELLLAAGSWTGGERLLQQKKLSTQICAAEMVLKGCTAVYDLYNEFPLPSKQGIDAAAEAYAEIGMRAVIAPLVADKSLFEAIPGLTESLPPALALKQAQRRRAPISTMLGALSDVVKHWRWNAHDIRIAVGPTIPLLCSDDLLCGCARLARDAGIGIHSHVSESKVQALAGTSRYGRSIVGHLHKLGLLGPDFTAAHAVWLDDDDFRMLADSGSSIAHNPGSNMRLGNGMFAMRRALEFGVNVGIGTDGVTCSDNQNMYESMRLASFSSKSQGPDPRKWASVEDVFKAATTGSARALGFDDIGVLQPGYKADMVFLDLSSLNWIPHNNSTNQLVHTEDGASVRHVMIGGRMVVESGKLKSVSLAKLAADAEEARLQLSHANLEAREAFPELEAAILDFCPSFAATPYAVNRYLEE